MIQKILVDVSAHGYGHAAQTLPVLTALRARDASLAITIRSGLPINFWRERITFPFDYICASSDFGMCMNSALDVDVAATFRQYSVQHENWVGKVAIAAKQLADINPDVLLANVAYLPLVAAAQIGIPAYAFCSLNWAEMFKFSCIYFSGAERIHAEILAAYQSARAFFQPSPCMPMPELHNGRAVGPIARIGVSKRRALLAGLGLPPESPTKLVLCSLGGIAHDIDTSNWPIFPADIRILMRTPRGALVPSHPNVSFIEPLSMEFFDVLCSCDAVITKPGYGMSVESACNGIPMLYVRRAGWPEEDAIVGWIHENNRALEISRESLDTGGWLDALEQLWQMPAASLPNASGANDIANVVLAKSLLF